MHPSGPRNCARSRIGNAALVGVLLVAGCGGDAAQSAEARDACAAGRALLESHRERPSQVTLDRAVQELERAADLAPAEAEIRYWAGRGREALEEDGLAQAHYRAAVESAPEHTDAHRRLGALLLGDGQLEAARVELERALQLGSREPQLFLDQGRVLEQLGDDAGARMAYERALVERPTFDDAYYRLSHLLRRMGDESGAERALAEFYRWNAAEMELTVALERARATPAEAEAAARVGLAAFQLQRADVSAGWLERALTLDPQHAVALQYRGMLHQASGELEAAERRLTASLSAAPGRAEVHRELGFLWLVQGRGSQATEELQRAVDLAPGDADMRFQQGLLLLQLKRLPAALAALDQALALDARHLEARMARAETLYGLGQTSLAAEEYRRVLQLDPIHEGALRSLAFLEQEADQ
ncbi:MAG: tetratricopeptide repeat protein [Planctomycetota bacterium]